MAVTIQQKREVLESAIFILEGFNGSTAYQYYIYSASEFEYSKYDKAIELAREALSKTSKDDVQEIRDLRNRLSGHISRVEAIKRSVECAIK